MQLISNRAKNLLLERYLDQSQEKLFYEIGFTALGLAYLDWKKGVAVLEQILEKMRSAAYQSTEGTLLQPPLLGFLLAGFYEKAPDEASAISFLRMAFGKVERFHRYLYQNRDSEEDGLLIITHPVENLLWPLTEKASKIKPVPESGSWQDPLFNALLVWSNECLLEIGTMLGEDVTEILLWNELTTFSLNENLWQEDASIYRAFNLSQKKIDDSNISLTNFMPLIAEIPDQDQAESMLEVLKSGALNYLLHPLPEEDRYTFPPGTKISIIANWLLYHGLWRFGMKSSAQKIWAFSIELMKRYGFRKIYDFSNGVPLFNTETTEYLPVAGLCTAWLEE